MEKVNAKEIELKISLKHEGLNVDVNPCVESRHVPHGRVLCFVWALDIYIYHLILYILGGPHEDAGRH